MFALLLGFNGCFLVVHLFPLHAAPVCALLKHVEIKFYAHGCHEFSVKAWGKWDKDQKRLHWGGWSVRKLQSHRKCFHMFSLSLLIL